MAPAEAVKRFYDLEAEYRERFGFGYGETTGFYKTLDEHIATMEEALRTGTPATKKG